MNIQELKEVIKDLPDLMDVQIVVDGMYVEIEFMDKVTPEGAEDGEEILLIIPEEL